MLRAFYGQFLALLLGRVGLEGRESLFTHLENKKIITEKFLGRHFSAIQQALEVQGLDNVHWIPGSGYPEDGLTKTKRDMAPLLRLLESGLHNPGISRPRKSIAPNEK